MEGGGGGRLPSMLAGKGSSSAMAMGERASDRSIDGGEENWVGFRRAGRGGRGGGAWGVWGFEMGEKPRREAKGEGKRVEAYVRRKETSLVEIDEIVTGTNIFTDFLPTAKK